MPSSLFLLVELGLCLPLVLLLVLGQMMGRWIRSPDFGSLYHGSRGVLLRLVYSGLIVVGAGTLLALMLLLLGVQLGWSPPDSWWSSARLELGGVLLAALLHLGLSFLSPVCSYTLPPRFPQAPTSSTRTRRKADRWERRISHER